MYINSFCSISPAGVLDAHASFGDLHRPNGNTATCIEPDYKELIPAMQLRRMSKPVRIGVAAARLCLQQASQPMPDAIHTGTAYGMLQDSETFLQQMIERDEQTLNPTAFIQSTHNTVAGQIALILGCNAHNMTYVHKGHSFESAMLDAEMMLQEHPEYEVLVGAVDESTETSYQVLRKFDLYHEHNMAGEGASFFSITAKEQEQSLAKITAFEMFIALSDEEVNEQIAKFIKDHQLEIGKEDMLLNGSWTATKALKPFAGNPSLDYAQYCGAYPTASSFALALGTLMIKDSRASNCWIIHSFDKYYSIWHLSQK